MCGGGSSVKLRVFISLRNRSMDAMEHVTRTERMALDRGFGKGFAKTKGIYFPDSL
jgi:hypothetical protein